MGVKPLNNNLIGPPPSLLNNNNNKQMNHIGSRQKIENDYEVPQTLNRLQSANIPGRQREEPM
jgi:hypothetical protein